MQYYITISGAARTLLLRLLGALVAQAQCPRAALDAPREHCLHHGVHHGLHIHCVLRTGLLEQHLSRSVEYVVADGETSGLVRVDLAVLLQIQLVADQRQADLFDIGVLLYFLEPVLHPYEGLHVGKVVD